jgi:transcriptional regulator with XRE-family HTH domain
LKEVRRIQGITQRTVARRLNTSVADVKLQECTDTDMPLSTLYRWQEVLDVPMIELLMEPEEPLSTPVLKRAQLVRLMKTAMAICERSKQIPIQRMAQVMVDQLIEIMPELAEVSPWHAVGKRRSQDEYGQAAFRQLPADLLADFGE